MRKTHRRGRRVERRIPPPRPCPARAPRSLSSGFSSVLVVSVVVTVLRRSSSREERLGGREHGCNRFESGEVFFFELEEGKLDRFFFSLSLHSLFLSFLRASFVSSFPFLVPLEMAATALLASSASPAAAGLQQWRRRPSLQAAGTASSIPSSTSRAPLLQSSSSPPLPSARRRSTLHKASAPPKSVPAKATVRSAADGRWKRDVSLVVERKREREKERFDFNAFFRPPRPLTLRKKKPKNRFQSHPDVVLVADVGGTNARFVLTRVGEEGASSTSSSSASSSSEEILQVIYPTSRHATFADALATLEREPGFVAPRAAAFAVAGPVARNRCEMTNLAWTIDGDFLSQKLGERSFFFCG